MLGWRYHLAVVLLGLLRLFGPLALAFASAFMVEHLTDRRLLQPPGFLPAGSSGWRLRRWLANALLGLALYAAVFQSLALLGLETEASLKQVETWQLFWLHWILLASLIGWYLLGFAGVRGVDARQVRALWRGQFGLAGVELPREVALGGLCGLLAWLGVTALMLLVGMLMAWLGWGGALPQQVPPMVAWIAAMPFAVRVAISVSAGVVEEVFFRGFLQPRIGLLGSTLLFCLAHLSYEQPFLLLGILLLSLGFGGLAAWRRSVWASILAHIVFDAIQLLVVIPAVLSDSAP